MADINGNQQSQLVQRLHPSKQSKNADFNKSAGKPFDVLPLAAVAVVASL
ncbi:hypothetical protein [Brucella pituitosa]|nr:hypothetical protein [Brucella pituitosa]